MSELVEYGTVARIRPIEGTVDFMVTVNLSKEPEGDWLEAFEENRKRCIFCPALRIEGLALSFISRWSSVRSRLDALRRVINRTNMLFTKRVELELKANQAATPAKPAEHPENVEALTKQLHAEGY